MPSIREIREIVEKYIKYAPTSIPHAGNIYAQILAEKTSKEFREELHIIKELSQDQIQNTDITNIQLEEIQEILIDIIGKKKSKKTKLTVIIPTGGEGGSLFPLTQVMPKCLVTIGRKSMLQHIIDPFYYYADLFDGVIITTNKYSEAIAENVKQGGYGDFVQCKQIVSKSLPYDILQLKSSLKDKPFLIHYNDILTEECDWEDICNRYFVDRSRLKIIGMLLCSKRYPLQLDIGIIEESSPRLLSSFTEKPMELIGSNLANVAIAIFEPEVFNYIEESQIGLFEETIPKIIEAKRAISLYEVGKWYHVQDLRGLYHLQNEVDLGFLDNRCII